MPAASPTPRLAVRTVPLDDAPADLLALLPALPAGELFSWVRRGTGIVGWGVAARVDTAGATRFADARVWWDGIVAGADVDDRVGRPGAGLVAFGSMAYSAASPTGGALVVPRVVVGTDESGAWLTTVSVDGDTGPSPDLTDLAALAAAPAPAQPGDIRFADGDQSAAAYVAAVEQAVARIGAGDVEKVVLARDLVATSGSPVDPRHLLRRLAETYPSTWVFSVDGLVGATPEMLVRLSKGLVTSRVLAGTIRRTGDAERDDALAGQLARSSKDLEEHEYAVASVAQALRPHTTSMNVPEAPFVLHLPNVMHLASDVTAVLGAHATSLELAESLHPSAAVCGTPRAAADALIAELEAMDRGRYAGPVGWLSADGDGEWGIGLRSGAVEGTHQVRLYAGCGIVAGSVPQAELGETDAKLLPMRDALGA